MFSRNLIISEVSSVTKLLSKVKIFQSFLKDLFQNRRKVAISLEKYQQIKNNKPLGKLRFHVSDDKNFP